MKTLDASKAVANFSRVLKAVHSLHESFAIVRKGVPYAYLIPPVERGSTSHELADDLAEVELRAEDRHSFAADIRKGHKALKSLNNPWG